MWLPIASTSLRIRARREFGLVDKLTLGVLRSARVRVLYEYIVLCCAIPYSVTRPPYSVTPSHIQSRVTKFSHAWPYSVTHDQIQSRVTKFSHAWPNSVTWLKMGICDWIWVFVTEYGAIWKNVTEYGNWPYYNIIHIYYLLSIISSLLVISY